MADTIFNLPDFMPFLAEWRARQAAFALRESYYDGTRYGRMREDLGWLYPRLYKAVKPLYLPLARAVDVDAGIVPGHWNFADPDKADGVSQSQVAGWHRARRQLFDWSGWVTRGVLFVHYGAVLGASGLKVVDLRDKGEVQVQPVNPRNFMLTSAGQYDSTPAQSIWIEMRTTEDGPVEYAEVITPDAVRTFWDGEPRGIDGRPAEYRNELAFVPFVEVRHIETGKMLGESTYQKAMPLLDEVNQLASYLADIIKKHTEPQYIGTGVEPSTLEHSGDNMWFITNPAGDVKALVPQIDIPGVLAFLQEIRDNVHGALPELAFDELKSKTQIATATVELQLMELILKIQRIRPNYDQGLIEAMRMAGRAAAGMGLPDLSVLDDEMLALDDARPILPVNPMDQIMLEQAQLALEMNRQMASGEGMTATATGPANAPA